MSISDISLKRPITSYSKVVKFLSDLKRGRKLFIRKKRIKDKVLLNVGCGPLSREEFINLDYEWTPTIDIVWDFTKKPIPLPSESLEGIYTEHCLEHITLDACLGTLKDFHRLLKPGGNVRIIVPDAQIYLDLYQARKTDPSIVLPYGEKEATAAISINRIMRLHGHLFIYDAETMGYLLEKAGFRNIKKESFSHGRDKRLLIDLEARKVESLYMEATK
ncbi:MAG TPA: methyltransferase domain-containing protein [Puia sp.]|nr:methyltransferase domain-containing protein [Puia sp.]